MAALQRMASHLYAWWCLQSLGLCVHFQRSPLFCTDCVIKENNWCFHGVGPFGLCTEICMAPFSVSSSSSSSSFSSSSFSSFHSCLAHCACRLQSMFLFPFGDLCPNFSCVDQRLNVVSLSEIEYGN